MSCFSENTPKPGFAVCAAACGQCGAACPQKLPAIAGLQRACVINI